MSVHVFPIESVLPSLLRGDSIQNVYRMARAFLGQYGQLGEVHDKYMECADRSSVEAGIGAFLDWATKRPNDEPKVLWLSLHGKPPGTKGTVGTAAVTAAYRPSEPNKAEIVDWGSSLAVLRGACPPNVLVLSDVCWGASPTAPRSVTQASGGNPKMFFGPVREAHRLELDTAAGLVYGLLIRGAVPSSDDAQTIVRNLNACFPTDHANENPFYRVWWWDAGGKAHRFPDAPESMICTRVSPPTE